MKNRRAILALAVYLAAVAIAAYVAMLGKFAGIYLVALTFPWSLFGVLLLDPKLFDNIAWGIGVVAVGVIANSFIIYYLMTRPGAKGSSGHAA
jgi:hypothetical protein